MSRASPFTEERFTIDSPETGHSYSITVELPSRYEAKSDGSFGVVICLDGQWTYGPVRDAFRILPLGKELPERIVVDVSYAEPDLRNILQLRAIDFTPTKYSAPAETGVTIPADQVGKAAPFRRFLVDSLLPLLDERYRTSSDRTLVGHSFSALFGLDTLLVEPDAFDRWVLASPSVWWDDQVMFRREAAHADTHDDLAATVFMSMGGEESSGDHPVFGGHEEIYEQLASRNYPSLDLSWALFPGETHQSVISGAVVRGLRAVSS